MKLSFILITFILLFSSTSAIQTTGMGAEGVNEVKSKIQTIEDKMNEVEALERQLLINMNLRHRFSLGTWEETA
ncbi:Uncharacterized protein QTN25_004360 [Entamoeba marina]